MKKNDYQLPKMCLSFANLKEKKGKYNGCNWEVVTLEVVQTCTFVPKRPSTWKAGRRARVLYFCSRLFLRSGPLVTARVEEVKLLLSAEALAGRYTKDMCSRLLTMGSRHLRERVESRAKHRLLSRDARFSVVGSRSLVTSAEGTGVPTGLIGDRHPVTQGT